MENLRAGRASNIACTSFHLLSDAHCVLSRNSELCAFCYTVYNEITVKFVVFAV